MGSDKDKGNINGLKINTIKEIGKIIKCMDMVYGSWKMDVLMKDNSKIIK